MKINEIEATFRKCGKTPAGGISYVSDDKDMCATIYGYGESKRAKLYYNREEGYEGREKLPCFYKDIDWCR